MTGGAASWASAKRTTLPFGEEHDLLRRTAARFFREECAPQRDAWEDAGQAPREIWRRAGELGLLCMGLPTQYGGGGGDILHSIAVMEEQVRAGVNAPMLSLHNDVVAPYIARYGSEAQRLQVLPRMASGDWIGAIAMTEPQSGSDLRGMRTTARNIGDGWLVNGNKTFISHGCTADIIVLAAKTAGDGGDRISLFLVEAANRKGLHRGPPLEKLGQSDADTAELAFEDMLLPASSLLGDIGGGFRMLSDRLVEERLMTGVGAVATIEAALGHTLAYVKQRHAFGQPVLNFQNTRFTLAEAFTEAAVLRTFMERCVRRFLRNDLDAVEAAMLKDRATDLQCSIVDACLQLHGGYGYVLDFPIARLWCDSRIAKIYGGANEIMKEIIGRAL